MHSSWKWTILAGHWTIKLGIQTAGRSKSFQSLVFILITQLHCAGQWSSSIPFAKFDCPVALQNISRLATAYGCESILILYIEHDLFKNIFKYFLSHRGSLSEAKVVQTILVWQDCVTYMYRCKGPINSLIISPYQLSAMSRSFIQIAG